MASNAPSVSCCDCARVSERLPPNNAEVTPYGISGTLDAESSGDLTAARDRKFRLGLIAERILLWNKNLLGVAR
jgi:hypothetical protein